MQLRDMTSFLIKIPM